MLEQLTAYMLAEIGGEKNDSEGYLDYYHLASLGIYNRTSSGKQVKTRL